jgi:hypothetical protein
VVAGVKRAISLMTLTGLFVGLGTAGCGPEARAPYQNEIARDAWGTSKDAKGNLTVNVEQPVRPRIFFATEGSTQELSSTLSHPEVISELQELHAGIALAVSELSPERARLVQRLNEADIPVTAWLALPADQGYYLNASNAAEATKRYAEFKKWSEAYQLRWDGVGLDIEPTVQEFGALAKGSRPKLAWTLLKRYFQTGRVERARKEYTALIREMRADKYAVQTYQFPFLADERKEHTTVLERLFGIVDVRGDTEVLMVYSSFNHKLDSALIWAYGPETQAIAIGVTNRDPSAPRFVPLNWEEFSRDLQMASSYGPVVGVYNLEGCVQQDFLPRLEKLNWPAPVTIPAVTAAEAVRFRHRVQLVLWIASRLPYFGAGFAVVSVGLIGWWLRRRKRQIAISRAA